MRTVRFLAKLFVVILCLPILLSIRVDESAEASGWDAMN